MVYNAVAILSFSLYTLLITVMFRNTEKLIMDIRIIHAINTMNLFSKMKYLNSLHFLLVFLATLLVSIPTTNSNSSLSVTSIFSSLMSFSKLNFLISKPRALTNMIMLIMPWNAVETRIKSLVNLTTLVSKTVYSNFFNTDKEYHKIINEAKYPIILIRYSVFGFFLNLISR